LSVFAARTRINSDGTTVDAVEVQTLFWQLRKRVCLRRSYTVSDYLKLATRKNKYSLTYRRFCADVYKRSIRRFGVQRTIRCFIIYHVHTMRVNSNVVTRNYSLGIRIYFTVLRKTDTTNSNIHIIHVIRINDIRDAIFRVDTFWGGPFNNTGLVTVACRRLSMDRRVRS